MHVKGAVLSAIAVSLIGAAFIIGVRIGEERIPAVEKVADLINKDGDALTAPVNRDIVDFMPYWRVWNTLEKKFIPFSTSTNASVSTEDRVYKSIEGLVASYNDPYTIFMRPQQAADFKVMTRGSLEGIGAVIGQSDGKLVVVGPLPGSPAEKAGLVAGDYIATVNGETTDNFSVDDAVSRIRGESGSTVVLGIVRAGQEARDVPVVRGTIEIPSTAHAIVQREVPKVAVTGTPEQGVSAGSGAPTSGTAGTPSSAGEPTEPPETEVKDFYVLRLFSFSQTAINSFARELKDFIESGSDSLIIDLRGNPGGYLDVAIQIASWFLPENTVVVRERQGPAQDEIVHRTTGGMLFKDKVPTVAILVDKGSASASEILAGALQEHGVAKLVGTNTFGKGSVQELINITDTLSLKVTVARWYTPNGVSISHGGLTPDIPIDPSSATSTDPWLDAAINYLTTGTTTPAQ